ncbi:MULTISPECIES: AAA family ATPase [unclassified Cyanobium]|uniref:AAA family ATPase n=1 Tax=unclassified Cyanobium TaxID=2627006 RepID=UPI0020CD0F39|nr:MULTISPECIES: AAA family ATPase [unclassified Cyanobium]MCP9860478.1 AAA family ATPase [Cyanobium sp. Cruz-8H5]MCP9867748.1 AAA family ATPase [Cyanobium sp. Cruz-8D1]
MSDLFSHQGEQARRRIAPLADRLRPRSLDDFVGQAAILGPGRLLRRAIAADRVGNLILHGPPGTGKTTLARIIAGSTRAHFSSLNAVLAGVKDLRAEVDAAKLRLEHHGLRTILFIDEVHRFNSAQQDALLPWVENGTVTLIGATTENPYFEVNKALVSRSRLFRLQPLEPEDLRLLLERALADPEHGYGQRSVELSEPAGAHLLDVAGGDARSLLNALELAVETTEADADGVIRIDLAIAEESIQQRAVLYDKQGDAHFDTISAFIKSIRGSDPDAALFWLARMVEAGENPRFILRRLLISAGEDIGLADPQAMVVVEACAAAFDRVGLPEGLYPLAHAALYLAGTEKSNSSLGFFDAVKAVRESRRQQVPAHLRDANRDGQAFGDGVGYRYPHAYADHWVAQQYLPQALQGEVFWQPGSLGWEGGLRKRLQQRRAAQLAAAAETAADGRGDLLSSSPDDPLLNRWLQRQAGAEGERLDRLRQRFWQDAAIGRLDRVLVVEAHSLLWALDPLEAASEGEVVLTTPSAAVLDRLQAQLQLLDQLRRPRLLAVASDAPEQLQTQLAGPPQGKGRFEWIAARQPWRHSSAAQRLAWLEQLTALAAPGARARLLFTHPLLGPAGSLRAHLLSRAAGDVPAVLERAATREQEWLAGDAELADRVQEGLEALGWHVQRRFWEEGLDLPLSDALLERWFGAEASYRKHLAAALPAAGRKSLEAQFRERRGTTLPQPLGHTLLLAQWSAEP